MFWYFSYIIHPIQFTFTIGQISNLSFETLPWWTLDFQFDLPILLVNKVIGTFDFDGRITSKEKKRKENLCIYSKLFCKYGKMMEEKTKKNKEEIRLHGYIYI